MASSALVCSIDMQALLIMNVSHACSLCVPSDIVTLDIEKLKERDCGHRCL